MIVVSNILFKFAVSKQFRSGDNTVNSAKDYDKDFIKRNDSNRLLR